MVIQTTANPDPLRGLAWLRSAAAASTNPSATKHVDPRLFDQGRIAGPFDMGTNPIRLAQAPVRALGLLAPVGAHPPAVAVLTIGLVSAFGRIGRLGAVPNVDEGHLRRQRGSGALLPRRLI